VITGQALHTGSVERRSEPMMATLAIDPTIVLGLTSVTPAVCMDSRRLGTT
jgi:hypothetical protein